VDAARRRRDIGERGIERLSRDNEHRDGPSEQHVTSRAAKWLYPTGVRDWYEGSLDTLGPREVRHVGPLDIVTVDFRILEFYSDSLRVQVVGPVTYHR
jgi:hypothetical protein